MVDRKSSKIGGGGDHLLGHGEGGQGEAAGLGVVSEGVVGPGGVGGCNSRSSYHYQKGLLELKDEDEGSITGKALVENYSKNL